MSKQKGMRKLLLSATDAGGARNLAPLVGVIKEQGYYPVLVTSRDMLPLFNIQDIEVIKSDSVDSESAGRLLNSIEPIAIICGTTRYMGAERFLIAAAKKLRIRSVVVLDEWFNYRIRFENEAGEVANLPDVITVMDELAKKEAVEEGLPAESCYITGSPALASLTSQAEHFVGSRPDIPVFLQSNHVRPVITFISETHAADYGSKPGERGPLGPYIGYTEDSVREDIFTILKRIDQPCVLVEKLHPAAKETDLSLPNHPKIRWLRITKTNLWALMWHTDLVIGMRSMALVEARILGRSAVSYQPGLIGIDHCTAARLGLVSKLSTPPELEQWCREQFTKVHAQGERLINRFPFARKDAAEKIVELTLNLKGVAIR